MISSTAILRDARIIVDRLGLVLSGKVFSDSRSYFEDGHQIFTSRIVSQDGDTYTTLSGCAYTVESWAK
ncbi:hypothetical protein PUR29_34680 [Methylobacterium ajmalii]|uniref:Uncharacterized protein n=1 Tax=Methylobacterium ajmalii TaxID=2738439 RepID=A0ABV0A454_9HYPH